MASPHKLLEKTPLVFSDQIQQKDGFYITITLPGTTAATAANYNHFFIARHPCEILVVKEVHGTAGTDAGAVTLDIEKLTGTTAAGSGDSILVAGFNLKGTANTVQSKSGADLTGQTLVEGDRLALEDTGTLTNVANLNVTLYLKHTNRGDYR